MKKSVRTSQANGCTNYSEVMEYWEKHCPSIVDGIETVDDFCEYLDDVRFPCDKVIVNPFCYNGFEYILVSEERVLATVKVKIKEYGFYSVEMKYEGITNRGLIKKFDEMLKGYFKSENYSIFIDFVGRCDIPKDEKGNYIVTVVYNENYKPTDRIVEYKGTLDEIFDRFTHNNETYRYCNGTYYTFKDKDIEKLYRMYVTAYDGNYFLMNAVEHGRIID